MSGVNRWTKLREHVQTLVNFGHVMESHEIRGKLGSRRSEVNIVRV